MALFTDGSIAALTDLKDYESSILDLASNEGIDLGAKLALAQRELALDVTGFLLRRGITPGPERRLTQVMVTEPLLHAHCIRTLVLIYRDASNSQLNDRYEAKRKQYSDLSHDAMKNLFGVGIAMSRCPISKAEIPDVTAVPGGILPTSTYYVAVAALGLTGTTGSWSDTSLLQAGPGTRLQVQLGELPQEATGWIVYAGTSEQSLMRQNDLPLSNGRIWTQPDTGLRTDLPGVKVQTPDVYIANRQELLRG